MTVMILSNERYLKLYKAITTVRHLQDIGLYQIDK